MGTIMFHMYSIVDYINLSFICFCVFLRITQVHNQYHVKTIRCVSTCINKQKCIRLVAVSIRSLATYLEGKNEAYSIHFVSLELVLAPWNALYLFPPGLCPPGGVTKDLNLSAYPIKCFRYANNK